jgi:hypothetical protein
MADSLSKAEDALTMAQKDCDRLPENTDPKIKKLFQDYKGNMEHVKKHVAAAKLEARITTIGIQGKYGNAKFSYNFRGHDAKGKLLKSQATMNRIGLIGTFGIGLLGLGLLAGY